MNSLIRRKARLLLLLSYLLLIAAPDLHHHHTICGHDHESGWHKKLDPCPVELLVQAHGDTVVPLVDTAPSLYYTPLVAFIPFPAGRELTLAASARAPPRI